MSNPNHDPKTGEFSSGPGGGSAIDPNTKAHLRTMLKDVRAEHGRLHGALKANTISNAGLDRLDNINKVLLRNAAAIIKLK